MLQYNIQFFFWAGISPIVGLYGAFMMGLVTAIFGGRPGMISGATGGEIILNNVFFETDSYQLMESSFTELNILLDYLQKNPLIKIHIEGHTDNIGGKEYNITLSKNRAAEVLSYLYDRGIEEQRMTYKGQGDNNPIATNKTELGRSKNRRTSFVIVK